MGSVLWLKSKSIEQIQRQKRIDQCLFDVIQNRCNSITTLSQLNSKIDLLTHTLALLKIGKITSAVIPGLNGLILATESASVEIRNIILFLQNYQDFIIKALGTTNLKLLQCSLPKFDSNEISFPQFKRITNWESEITNTKGIILWKNQSYLSEIYIYSKDLISKSFAHCEPENALLNMKGESYAVSFQEISKNKGVSLPLNLPLPSLQSSAY